MNTNEIFINHHLAKSTCADNYVFYNFNFNQLSTIIKHIQTEYKSQNPCIINVLQNDDKSLCKTLSCFNDDHLKKLIARDYICAQIKQQLLKTKNMQDKNVNNILNAILNGDTNLVKELHAQAPMPYEITKLAKKLEVKEIYIFLQNQQNVYVGQAINNFISSREPYAIKLFTSQPHLSTNYDQMGNLVQSPHDYISINYNPEKYGEK